MGLFKRVDLLLVTPALVLVGISLTILFSVNTSFFQNQLIFFLLSLIVFLFFANADFSVWDSFSKPIYAIACMGLLIVLVLGYESRGSVRWLDFLGLRLQFSEILKPFLALSLSVFLAKHKPSGSTIGKLLLFLLPILFFIYKQPDLGSALMYAFTVILTLIIFGYPLWWFASLGIGFAAIIPLVFRFLHGYQQQRILTFLHLTNDPLGSSYNAIQAVIAVGSGMLVGKGLGQGTQSGLHFLPEQHTDFIFATLSEALGFIGVLVVLVAFGFLLYRLYRIAQNADSLEKRLFVIAAFSLFFVQFFVNIGMNIGILPIVGVTLPFVSYGGSSLLSSAIFLGFASGIGTLGKDKSVLEIK